MNIMLSYCRKMNIFNNQKKSILRFFVFITAFYFSNNHSFSQEFWLPVGQQDISSVSFVSSDAKGRIYVGNTVGLYRSSDNGLSWLNIGLEKRNLQSLIVDHKGNIFVGTLDSGIYISNDDGLTWVHNKLGSGSVSILAKNNESLVFAVLTSGVISTSDNGATWKTTSLSIGGIISLNISQNNNLFALTFNELHRSTDNGTTWNNISSGITESALKSIAIDNNNNIFVGTRYGSLYRTSNFGENWISISDQLKSHSVNAIAASIEGDIFVGTNDLGFARSGNNGLDWSYFNSGLKNFNIRSLMIDNNGYLLLSTSGGEIYRSTYKISEIKLPPPTLSFPGTGSQNLREEITFVWNPLQGANEYSIQISTDSSFMSTNINENQLVFSSIAIKSLSYNTTYYWRVNASNFGGNSPWSSIWSFRTRIEPPSFWQEIGRTDRIKTLAVNNENVFFSGSYAGYGMYTSVDNGFSWIEIERSNSIVHAFAFRGKDSVFAGLAPGGIFLSTDKGFHWDQYGLPLEEIHSLAFNSKNVLYASGYRYVYITSDNGKSWKQTYVNDGILHQIVIDKTNDNVYACSHAGGIYLLSPDGNTWTLFGVKNSIVRGLAFNSKHYMFAITDNNGVIRSTDDGKNWVPVNYGIYDSTIISIAVSDNDFIYVSTPSDGVFLSRNDGETWEDISGGLKDKIIMSLIIDKKGYLLAGSKQGWIYKSKQTAITAIKPINSILPNEFILDQNYPNPFNPTTNIRFSIPKYCFITLSIYDILGKEICTLLNENKSAGNYEVQFNAANFSSGMYFYKLQSDGFSISKKLMLIK